MSIQAVVGINWGDEGKGRMIDYLAQDADAVVRYQGGNNAGHTVINSFGTFKLNLIPSGIFNSECLNVLGTGMVLDLGHLEKELNGLKERGIPTDNLRISDRATLCLPFHPLEDAWEEERLGKSSFGSTKRGIAPAYSDRALKKALQVGDLFHDAYLKERLEGLVEWKNKVISGVYGQDASLKTTELHDWAVRMRDFIAPYVCDTGVLLDEMAAQGKSILFEAQLGALRDLYYGIYPFTSSSNTLAGFAPVGGGIPGRQVDRVLGVMKAFSTCVGAGPFVTEMEEATAEEWRQQTGEYGASTGRPRRIGHFDAVASRYGVRLQGATELALTKLDNLSGKGELFLCTHYEVNGKALTDFPVNAVLNECRPVYQKMPGWTEDISRVRRFEDLPREARDYVLEVERLVGCSIKFVSVGPDRDCLMVR